MKWIDNEAALPNVLRRRAEEDPDRVYLREVDGRTWTYGQSYERTLLWANALRELGVGPGDNVLTMLPNGPDSYHLWVGLAWLGAVDVSLSTDYRGRMLTHTITTSDARILIVPSRFLGQVEAVAGELQNLRTVVVPDAEADHPGLPQFVVGRAELFDGIEPTAVPDVHSPAVWDVSCIIWTSGTTGPSKGVMVPWAEMYSFTHVVSSIADGQDVTYHYLPPHHNSGKVLYYGAMLLGTDLVMRETFSVSNFWQDVREHDVTYTVLFEPMLRMLASAATRADDADNPLRRIGCAPLPDDLDGFLRRFGIEGANTYYGMTEIGLPFASEGVQLANLDSCGRLRDEYYEARIVDEHDYPVATGQVGELIVRSHHPWFMNVGYHGLPERTAQAWLNGWFHTGDAFRVDEDGNYYFVDRLKDTIRRRGENISSFEVESYVNEHPGVALSAAVAVPSELGEDEVKVFVVRAEAAAPVEPEQLLEWLAPQMPRFMLPRFVEFVDGLPQTEATFRTRKAELRSLGNSSHTWDREAADLRLPS